MPEPGVSDQLAQRELLRRKGLIAQSNVAMPTRRPPKNEYPQVTKINKSRPLDPSTSSSEILGEELENNSQTQRQGVDVNPAGSVQTEKSSIEDGDGTSDGTPMWLYGKGVGLGPSRDPKRPIDTAVRQDAVEARSKVSEKGNDGVNPADVTTEGAGQPHEVHREEPQETAERPNPRVTTEQHDPDETRATAVAPVAETTVAETEDEWEATKASANNFPVDGIRGNVSVDIGKQQGRLRGALTRLKQMFGRNRGEASVATSSGAAETATPQPGEPAAVQERPEAPQDLIQEETDINEADLAGLFKKRSNLFNELDSIEKKGRKLADSKDILRLNEAIEKTTKAINDQIKSRYKLPAKISTDAERTQAESQIRDALAEQMRTRWQLEAGHPEGTISDEMQNEIDLAIQIELALSKIAREEYKLDDYKIESEANLKLNESGIHPPRYVDNSGGVLAGEPDNPLGNVPIGSGLPSQAEIDALLADVTAWGDGVDTTGEATVSHTGPTAEEDQSSRLQTLSEIFRTLSGSSADEKEIEAVVRFALIAINTPKEPKPYVPANEILLVREAIRIQAILQFEDENWMMIDGTAFDRQRTELVNAYKELLAEQYFPQAGELDEAQLIKVKDDLDKAIIKQTELVNTYNAEHLAPDAKYADFESWDRKYRVLVAKLNALSLLQGEINERAGVRGIAIAEPVSGAGTAAKEEQTRKEELDKLLSELRITEQEEKLDELALQRLNPKSEEEQKSIQQLYDNEMSAYTSANDNWYSNLSEEVLKSDRAEVDKQLARLIELRPGPLGSDEVADRIDSAERILRLRKTVYDRIYTDNFVRTFGPFDPSKSSKPE